MADKPAAGGGGGGGAKGKVENPITVLILGLVTCGLYSLYWMWVRTKEMNDYLGKQQVNPMFVMPGCFCLPILIYAEFLFAKGVDEMTKKAGTSQKEDFLINFILFLVLTPVGQYMVQQKLNEIWQK